MTDPHVSSDDTAIAAAYRDAAAKARERFLRVASEIADSGTAWRSDETRLVNAFRRLQEERLRVRLTRDYRRSPEDVERILDDCPREVVLDAIVPRGGVEHAYGPGEMPKGLAMAISSAVEAPPAADVPPAGVSGPAEGRGASTGFVGPRSRKEEFWSAPYGPLDPRPGIIENLEQMASGQKPTGPKPVGAGIAHGVPQGRPDASTAQADFARAEAMFSGQPVRHGSKS